ncbi:MAG: hypothetical protein IKZ84_15175, partial [Victivallales bacterium]|nr:hypothetical protein [Victivallales bacterium]
RCEMVDAPGKPGLKTLKLTFRTKEHKQDWLDVQYKPLPTLDWSAEDFVELPYYAVTPGIHLYVKIMGDNAANANKAVIEYPLPARGEEPPTAGQWHMLKLALPKDKLTKTSVNTVSVYCPMLEQNALPLNEDVVFYVGLAKYKPKPRVPWPPVKEKVARKVQVVWDSPVTEGSPWLKVKDRNNQNDHTAEFIDGAICFVSTANGWNEFSWSDHLRLKLKPETLYRLDFDYDVTVDLSGPNCMFYSLIRCGEPITKDVGWQQWLGGEGQSGHRSNFFTTKENPDYRVIFGVRDMGGIRIRNIRIVEIQ